MKTEHILEFHEILRKENLCFIYQGDFSDAITEKIINLSEHSIEQGSDVMQKMKKKISYLIVECFQNIVRHGNTTNNSNRTITLPSLFSARSTDECVYITSANLIENIQIPALKEKLERLNNLDNNAIKTLYMEILSKNVISGKGGAGLGLVEMARKSGNPLEYDFENENDKLSLFYLMLKMKDKGVINIEDNISLGSMKQIHDVMRKENILLVYKGDFSQETIIPLLKMIEDNLNKHQEEYTTKKKLYLILVEVLQNVSKHSLEQNGKRDAIFMIGKKGHKYNICTGNLIDSVSAEKLTNKIDKVNSMDRTALVKFYKTTLKEGLATEKGAGLGIIDVAKEASDKIIYELSETGDGIFLSLNVSI